MLRFMHTSVWDYLLLLYLYGRSTPSVHKPGVWHLIAGSAIVVNRFLLTTVMTKRIFLLHRMYPLLVYITWDIITSTLIVQIVTQYTPYWFGVIQMDWLGQMAAESNSIYDQTLILYRTIFQGLHPFHIAYQLSLSDQVFQGLLLIINI